VPKIDSSFACEHDHVALSGRGFSNQAPQFQPRPASLPIFSYLGVTCDDALLRWQWPHFHFKNALQKSTGDVTDTTSIFFYSLWFIHMPYLDLGLFRALFYCMIFNKTSIWLDMLHLFCVLILLLELYLTRKMKCNRDINLHLHYKKNVSVTVTVCITFPGLYFLASLWFLTCTHSPITRTWKLSPLLALITLSIKTLTSCTTVSGLVNRCLYVSTYLMEYLPVTYPYRPSSVFHLLSSTIHRLPAFLPLSTPAIETLVTIPGKFHFKHSSVSLLTCILLCQIHASV